MKKKLILLTLLVLSIYGYGQQRPVQEINAQIKAYYEECNSCDSLLVTDGKRVIGYISKQDMYQMLSINGTELKISNGNTVDLSGLVPGVEPTLDEIAKNGNTTEESLNVESTNGVSTVKVYNASTGEDVSLESNKISRNLNGIEQSSLTFNDENGSTAGLVSDTRISALPPLNPSDLVTLDYFNDNQSESGVSSVVAGTGISVNNTDPANPVVSSIITTPTLDEVVAAGNQVYINRPLVVNEDSYFLARDLSRGSTRTQLDSRGLEIYNYSGSRYEIYTSGDEFRFSAPTLYNNTTHSDRLVLYRQVTQGSTPYEEIAIGIKGRAKGYPAINSDELTTLGQVMDSISSGGTTPTLQQVTDQGNITSNYLEVAAQPGNPFTQRSTYGPISIHHYDASGEVGNLLWNVSADLGGKPTREYTRISRGTSNLFIDESQDATNGAVVIGTVGSQRGRLEIAPGLNSYDAVTLGQMQDSIKVDRVENVSDLRLMTGKTGDVVELLGYYEKGDGGGGTFYWDETADASDNGGTKFGKWLRKDTKVLFVDWFGAKGNGTFNDTDAYNKALQVIDDNGGGTLLFSAGKTYRITGGNLIDTNNREYIPDNTHIVATGAVIKATDEGNGIAISFVRTTGSSITGGTFDGNWDGGTGDGSWGGATGVVSDDGSSGNQSPLTISNTFDCIITDVKSINAVNDGISGSHNEGLVLKNCESRDTGEHGFYFSYSKDIYSSHCRAINIGRNNWDKGAVMFKMRDGTQYHLTDFYGHNIDPQARAGVTEGSGSHLYISNSRFVNVSSGLYFLGTPSNFDTENHNIHLEDSYFSSTDDASLFISGDMNKESTMSNITTIGFSMVSVFPFSRNIRALQCGTSYSTGSTFSTPIEKNDISDLTISLRQGYISFNGTEKSIFNKVTIESGDNGFLPSIISLYAADSDFKDLTYKAPPGTFTTQRVFGIRADSIRIDGFNTENIPTSIVSESLDNITTTILNANIKGTGGGAFIRDNQSNNTWHVHNSVVDNVNNVFYLGNATNSLVYHSNIRVTNSTFTDIPGSMNHVQEEGVLAFDEEDETKTLSISGSLQAGRYFTLVDYDDPINSGNGIKTYMRDGDWVISKNDNELNPLRIMLSGQEVYHAGNLRSNLENDQRYLFPSRMITTGIGLTGGGDLTANREISLTSITSGDNTVGAIQYNSLTKAAGQFYGGNSNPSALIRLNYDGNLHATEFVTPSDRRLKTNLVPIKNAVDKVEQLTGYIYNLKSDNSESTGIIAQDLIGVFEQALRGSEEDGYGVKYGNMVGLLIQAIKEQQNEIDELKTLISKQ